jgi:hypothetical protein
MRILISILIVVILNLSVVLASCSSDDQCGTWPERLACIEGECTQRTPCTIDSDCRDEEACTGTYCYRAKCDYYGVQTNHTCEPNWKTIGAELFLVSLVIAGIVYDRKKK